MAVSVWWVRHCTGLRFYFPTKAFGQHLGLKSLCLNTIDFILLSGVSLTNHFSFFTLFSVSFL